MSKILFNPLSGGFDFTANSDNWKDPVSTSASLPASGNSEGDIRLATDTKILYEWDGSSWTAITTGSSSGTQIDTFTLSAGDITNKYVILSAVPTTSTKVQLFVQSAPHQYYGDDFQVTADNGGKRLSWDSLSLDGILESGDKITALYT